MKYAILLLCLALCAACSRPVPEAPGPTAFPTYEAQFPLSGETLPLDVQEWLMGEDDDEVPEKPDWTTPETTESGSDLTPVPTAGEMKPVP